MKIEFGNKPDIYASHLGILAACFSLTRGEVLEVGGGVYSTPMLHGLCVGSGRHMLTLENHGDWAEFLRANYEFVGAGTRVGSHVIKDADFAGPVGAFACKWGLTFVDNDPACQRVHVVQSIPEPGVLVMHDTQGCTPVQFSQLFDRFKWVFRCIPPPWEYETTVAGNGTPPYELAWMFPTGKIVVGESLWEKVMREGRAI
jgi:hypothetical protein